MIEQYTNGTKHTIQAATWTQIATTSYECRDCGEYATTPRGFSDRCVRTDTDRTETVVDVSKGVENNE